MANKSLLIGCGKSKKIELVLYNKNPDKIITLDINKDCKPDVLWDLTKHPLPFKDEEFDQVHAYDVLEHLAYQGDYEFFFKEFSEYWRILKNNGYFCASVPKKESIWALGDPSHKRIITIEQIIYLEQKIYEQCGKTKISDFRYIWKKNFEIVDVNLENKDLIYFVLQKKFYER